MTGAVWFTGLSGAGKSTLARAVYDWLTTHGHQAHVLDGEAVRDARHNRDFSREGRDHHVRCLAATAAALARDGSIVLVAAIAPYRSLREEIRLGFKNWIEVYVSTPLEVCEARDPKGHYRRARAGQLLDFTGIHDPYEPPLTPDLCCDTAAESVESGTERVVARITSAFGKSN